MFYKTHKISRKDFLSKLEAASSDQAREDLLLSLYDDAAQQGRKGTLNLSKAVKIIRKKVDDR
jgi:hypothetical protein